MQRNLDHRVEAVVDVVDPSLTAELDELVTLLLHPDVSCWHLDGEGRWHRFESLSSEDDDAGPKHVRGNGTIDVHRELQAMAKARSSG